MKAFREKLAIVIGGLIVFVFINVLSNYKSKASLKVEITIPENTHSYTRIETSSLIKKAAFNLLFEVKNQHLFDALFEKIETNQKESEFEKLNVNPLKAIEIIELNSNPSLMIARMSAANSNIKTDCKWNNLNVFQHEAYIYISENKKAILTLISDLKKQPKKFLLLPEDIIRCVFENGTKKIQKIQFKKNGIYVTNSSENNQRYKVLKPSGFHYSGAFDGKSLQTQLKKIPYLNKCNLEQISRVSLNYEGFEFTDTDSLPGIPKLDILLSFNSPTLAKPFIQQLFVIANKKLISNERYFDLGASKLYFHQESPTQVYLSTQHETAFFTTTRNSSLILGDLNDLTHIENAGWKAAILELLPGFTATKNFFSHFEPIEHHLTNKKETFILKTKQNKNLYESLFSWLLAF